MAIRVTRPVTKNGRYYKDGEVIEDPSGFELSLARIWGWDRDFQPVRNPTKPELVQTAKGRGLDPSGLTKAELIDLLEE